MKTMLVLAMAMLFAGAAFAQDTGLVVTFSDTEAGKLITVTMDGQVITPDSMTLNGEPVEGMIVTNLPSFIVTVFYAGKSASIQYTDMALASFPRYLNR